MVNRVIDEEIMKSIKKYVKKKVTYIMLVW